MKNYHLDLELFLFSKSEKEEYRRVLSYFLRYIVFNQWFNCSAVRLLANVLYDATDAQFIARLSDFPNFDIYLINDILKIRKEVNEKFHIG